jgi:hypothetical protein
MISTISKKQLLIPTTKGLELFDLTPYADLSKPGLKKQQQLNMMGTTWKHVTSEYQSNKALFLLAMNGVWTQLKFPQQEKKNQRQNSR